MREIEAYTPIQDQDEERILLSTVLAKRSAFHMVADIITDEAFTLPFHRSVWNACKELSSSGSVINPIFVKKRLDASGASYTMAQFASLMGADALVFDDEVEALARHLNSLAIRRSFRPIATKLALASTNESDDFEKVIEDSIRELSSTGASEDGVHDMNENLRAVHDIMLENMDPNKKIGSPTGFRDYDRKTGGLFPIDFVLIAADSSQGKTSLALKMVLEAARAGDGCAIYSLEMTGPQLTARLMSMTSGIQSDRILRHHLSKDEYDTASSGLNALMGLPIYTDDHSTSMIDSIITSIRSMVIKRCVKVAVIDFLQVLACNQRTYNQDAFLGECCRKLKNLAKDLGICVIALSQLSRDREKPEPTLSRLRGSGQMNEAADVTILLYRPEYYRSRYPDQFKNLRYPEPFQNVEPRGTALIRVAKSRNSEPFDMIVGFDHATTRFYDIDGRIPEISVQNSRYNEPDPF